MDAVPPSPEFLAESQGPTVKAVMWLMSGLAAVFVMLRLYVRLHLKRVFGWDDLIAVVAVVGQPEVENALILPESNIHVFSRAAFSVTPPSVMLQQMLG
jgi:hypothetical protein